MILWHLLSRSRLDQKINYSKINDGKLMLSKPIANKDISSGELGEFIYCLPTLVGGASFADESQLQALRIDLKEDARLSKFTGCPDDLNFGELLNNFDGLDMRVEASDTWPVTSHQLGPTCKG